MNRRGVKLGEITFEQAKEWLTENTIVVLPVGGGVKEHGDHLPMGTDLFVTDWIAEQVTARYPVVCLPTLPYAYFPAFVDWKGSVSVPAQSLITFARDILLNFVKLGVKKFLILDGGVSTQMPLKTLSLDMLVDYGVHVGVTNISGLGYETREQVCEQERGGHADESETSCMLHIRGELVHMEKAVEEYSAGLKSCVKNGQPRVYLSGKMNTPHGTNGNSKLATKEKGEKILHAMVDDIVCFLEEFDSRF